MKYSLFNEEVEGFTREKLFSVKLLILSLMILAGAVFIGWVMNVGTWVQVFMDQYADVL